MLKWHDDYVLNVVIPRLRKAIIGYAEAIPFPWIRRQNMLVELKIKIISLADEARTIRKEQNKIPKGRRQGQFQSLHHHRTMVVRPESRAAHLAYGYLRGVQYRQMEAKCWVKPDWDKVLRIAKKFAPESHPLITADSIKAWAEETSQSRTIQEERITA